VLAGFEALKRRRVDVSLLYSSDDVGLQYARLHLGCDRKRSGRFPNTRLTVIADADHNLTPPHAQDIYLAEVRDMALRLNGGAPLTVSEERAVRSRSHEDLQASGSGPTAAYLAPLRRVGRA
jgi:hypothetical protein